MYSARIGDISGTIGSTGLGGDGLGFFFPGMEQLISKVLAPPPAPVVEKKAPVSFTFCPPGMTPNPQWSAIPEEARSQAAAAGVQACLPGPEGKKGKPQCFFTIGTRKFKCDQGEFSRAYSVARARANKRPSGKSSIQLQIGSRTIMIPVRAGVALPGAGAPGTPGAGVPAMRNPMTGAFECSPGMRIAQNAQGQVVCVPTSALPGAPGAPGGMPSHGRRRRGRGRGRRGGYRDGLGEGIPQSVVPMPTSSPFVADIQAAVGVPVTGMRDPSTRGMIQDLQAYFGLPTTGRLDHQTSIALAPYRMQSGRLRVFAIEGQKIRHEMRGALGDAAEPCPPETMRFVTQCYDERGRLIASSTQDKLVGRGQQVRGALGFVHYPPDYQTTMFRQGQYAQGLARYAENGAPLAVTQPFSRFKIPAWMAARVPPTPNGARQSFDLAGAFGGAPLGRGSIY